MAATTEALMIVAGEASGDEHAAALFRQLRADRPDVEAYGLAGDELIAAGVEPIGHSSSIAVVGIVEAFKVLSVARELFRRLLTEAERRGTRVAVLVDSPGFNLRLARALHRRGVRVLYYISPQLWAWRAGRVDAIRRYVDKVLVLFEFEVAWYRQHGVEAVHVGHPLVDSVPQLETVWGRTAQSLPGGVTVSFMPGSRHSEVDRLLPEMVAAARALDERLPQVRFQVVCARNLDAETLLQPFADAGVTAKVVDRDRYAAIADSHLVICASGTATLEVGLLGVPMIVVYKLQALTHRLAKRVVKTRYVSLVNLVLDDGVVPELLQDEARGSNIARAALDLLEDRGRIENTRRRLAGLRPALGEAGASRRAATEVSRFLSSAPAAEAADGAAS